MSESLQRIGTWPDIIIHVERLLTSRWNVYVLHLAWSGGAYGLACAETWCVTLKRVYGNMVLIHIDLHSTSRYESILGALASKR